MQEIRLHSLTIKSFKGIKDLHIDFKDITTIIGKNGVYKSTIFDAFNWLLFGKNSLGATDFEIRRLDKNNQPQHKGEHSVTGKINDYEICRVTRENWVKSKGEEEEHLEGFETIFTVDGSVYKSTEFKTFVSKLVDESIFKMLTNVAYFNSLHWTERRKVLFSLITDYSDIQIAGKDADFIKIVDFLKDKQLDFVKKDIKSKISACKKELNPISALITEQERNIPELSDFEALKKERASISNPDTINAEIDADNQKIEEEINNARIKHHQEQTVKRTESNNSSQEIATANINIASKKAVIEIEEKILANLRTDYDNKLAETYSPKSCPTCGQKVADYTEEKFKETKLTQLTQIKKNGISQKEKVDKLKKELSEITVPEIIPFVEISFDDTKLRSKIKPRTVIDQTVLNKIKSLDEAIGKESLINQIKERIEELKKKNQVLSKQLASLERTELHIERWTKFKSDFMIDKINAMFKFCRFKLYEFTFEGNPVECCETLVDGVPYSTNLNTGAKINAGIEIVDVLSKFYGIKCPVFVDNMESCTEPIEIDCQTIHLIASKEYNQLTIL